MIQFQRKPRKAVLPDGTELWRCCDCKKNLPVEAFYLPVAKWSRCKECHKQRVKVLKSSGTKPEPAYAINDENYLVLIERMRDQAQRTAQKFVHVMSEALKDYLAKVGASE